MLSERDRRILHEMERQLSDEDRRMESVTHRTRRHQRRLRRGVDVALVLSVLSALLCFALATRATTGAGVVATGLVAALLLVRRSPGRPLAAGPSVRALRRWFTTPRGRAPRR